MPTREMKQQLRDLIRFLRAAGRYTDLVRNLESVDWPSRSFIFEAIFAGKFEAAGCQLRYEVAVNRNSTERMDFCYPATGTPRVCFELVSPRVRDPVRRTYGPHLTATPGLLVEGARLSSDDPDQRLRPEAQAIRLQEKLLEKVAKLPEPSAHVFAVLVVDCTAINFGMLDQEDCRMLMFGRTRSAATQEFWREGRIIGLLEEAHRSRDAGLLRERASAVILVREFAWDPFPGAFLVLNNLRSLGHRVRLREELSHLPPVNTLVEVVE